MQDRIPLSLVIPSLDSGGAEHHLLQILPLLQSSQFELRLHVLRGGGRLLDAFKARGVPLIVCTGFAARLQAIRLLLINVYSRRPIVHCFLPESYVLGGILGLVFGAHAVVVSRRSRNYYLAHHPVVAWIERRLHRRVSMLLANSRSVVQDLLDEGAPPSRVRLLYNGVDVNRFHVGAERFFIRQALRSSLSLSAHSIVLVCVANLFPYKGHADLLKALSLIPLNSDIPIELLLVGRDVGLRLPLQDLARDLSLDPHVHFLGERDDIPDLLAASDISVLASHQEGFSNAVLESMAAALPMVVTDVGGNAEAVIHGESGFVVPPRDPVSLAKAISVLLADANLCKTMGDAGRRRVVASFSLEASVAAYASLYQEVWDRAMTKRVPSMVPWQT